MNLKQFVDKWLGKKIDFDNAYQGQCVDLFRQYNKEVLEISQPRSVVGAADFWANYDTDTNLKQNFTKISNTADFKPLEGDVMIWNKRSGGGFGHIAVVYGSDQTLDYFYSFDQNWSKISYCEIVKHTYSNVYGVLRPLKITQEFMTEKEWQIERDERNKNWNLYQEELLKVSNLKSTISVKDETIKTEQKKHQDLIEFIINKISPLMAFVDGSEESARTSILNLISNQDKLDKEIKDTRTAAEKKEQELIHKNEVLQGQLDTLQTQFNKLKGDHQRELDLMQNRIDTVQAQVEINNDAKQENSKFITWIEDIIKKLKG